MELILGMIALVAGGGAAWAMMGLRGLEARADAAEKQAATAAADAEKATGRIAELEKKLGKARTSDSAREDKASAAGERLASQEQDIRRLRETLERTTGRDTAAQAQIASLQATVQRLTEEVGAAQTQSSQVREQVDRAQDDLKKVEESRRRAALQELRASAADKTAGAAYQARVESIVKRSNDVKERAIRAEKESRISRKRAQASERAYRMTLAQLDLAQDRIYSLENNGAEPPVRKKRLEKALGNAQAIAAAALAPSVAPAKPTAEPAETAEPVETATIIDPAPTPAAPSAPRKVKIPSGAPAAEKAEPTEDAEPADDLAAELEELAARANERVS